MIGHSVAKRGEKIVGDLINALLHLRANPARGAAGDHHPI
jgi:hypothetical protein